MKLVKKNDQWHVGDGEKLYPITIIDGVMREAVGISRPPKPVRVKADDVDDDDLGGCPACEQGNKADKT